MQVLEHLIWRITIVLCTWVPTNGKIWRLKRGKYHER